MRIQRKEKGFTIIEVVLVLAIAGLIFLMVFLALPALQRNQKDTQRKNDLNRAQTALTNYQTNNKNSLPGTTAAQWQAFENTYLLMTDAAGKSTESFIDPAGTNTANASAIGYVFTPLAAATAVGAFGPDSTQNIIYYTVGTVCDTGGSVKSAGSTKVALRMALEGGGVACVNN